MSGPPAGILPDHLAPGLDLVFCGTAPGWDSAARGHYYANAGNRFWPTLFETGLVPERLGPEDDHRLPQFGIGLTDLAKTACGMDADIPAAAWDAPRLFALVERWRPRALAFTSLTAARLAMGDRRVAAGLLPASPFPHTCCWALPSPSGRARSHWDAGPWHALAASLR